MVDDLTRNNYRQQVLPRYAKSPDFAFFKKLLKTKKYQKSPDFFHEYF